MIHPRLKRLYSTVALGLGVIGFPAASHALSFNFTHAANMDANAVAGFAAAGTRWSTLFNDNVTVNIAIGFGGLGSNTLASAGSTQMLQTYSQIKNAMALDQTSADDATAVANLQAGPALRLVMNRTAEVGGTASLFLDTAGANNTNIRLNTANAKALGLLGANDPVVDAQITFGDTFVWDFNPGNGITGGAYDFVGIATHEIGHALGFVSGVDVLDFYSPPNGIFSANAFTYVSTLDLFRRSVVANTVNAIDWSVDTRDKFFSINNGVTFGAKFSNGHYNGDGNQASHWKDSLGLGVMDPTAATGELLAISANDIQAFDVIGWNRASVPDETSSLVLMGLGVAAIAVLRRRMKVSPPAA